MQFGIGVIFGFVLFTVIDSITDMKRVIRIREEGYQKGYVDAEMQYKKAVKPVILEENTVDVDFECPCCGRHTVSEWEHRPQYCADCGCKIDWEEEEI